MAYQLSEGQTAALRERFGELLDVEHELRAARDYAEHFHRGRPYQNYGRFVWNWLRKSAEKVERRRRVAATGQPRPQTALPARDNLTPEQLRAIVEDPEESLEMRELAAEILKRTGK